MPFSAGPYNSIFFELFFAARAIIEYEAVPSHATQPGGSKSRSLGDGTHEKTETAATSNPETKLKNAFQDGLLPPRPMAVPMAAVASLWIAVVGFYFTWLLIYGQDLTFKGYFNAKLYIPLFCGAICHLCWRIAASVVHYKPAKQLDSLVFSWRISWPVQWALCIVWSNTITEIVPALMYPFFEPDGCHMLPVLCPLNAAYTESVTARMCFWLLIAALGCGYMAFILLILWIKTIIGASIIFILYQAGIRGLLLRFVLLPIMQYGFRPLWISVVRPLSAFVSGHMATPIRRYIVGPLAKTFPGPSTKTKDFFPDPNLDFVVVTLVTSPLYVLETLAIISTISEVDTHLAAQRDSMNLSLHLAVFCSMAMWLLWRVASALNFGPAVHLDGFVYASRIGWAVQFFLCFPWLYTLWKMLYFHLAVFVLHHEGIFGRAFLIISNLGALDLRIIRVNIIGAILKFVTVVFHVAGIVTTVMFIAHALVACCERVGGKGTKSASTPSESRLLPLKKRSEHVESKLV